MADGDILFIRVPITVDYLAVADTVRDTLVAGAFPTTAVDVVEMASTDVSGKSTVRKLVLTYVVRLS